MIWEFANKRSNLFDVSCVCCGQFTTTRGRESNFRQKLCWCVSLSFLLQPLATNQMRISCSPNEGVVGDGEIMGVILFNYGRTIGSYGN